MAVTTQGLATRLVRGAEDGRGTVVIVFHSGTFVLDDLEHHDEVIQHPSSPTCSPGYNPAVAAPETRLAIRRTSQWTCDRNSTEPCGRNQYLDRPLRSTPR